MKRIFAALGLSILASTAYAETTRVVSCHFAGGHHGPAFTLTVNRSQANGSDNLFFAKVTTSGIAIFEEQVTPSIEDKNGSLIYFFNAISSDKRIELHYVGQQMEQYVMETTEHGHMGRYGRCEIRPL